MNARMLLGAAAAVCILVPALAGCYPISAVRVLTGSGHPVTKDMDVTGFTAVDAGGAFQVTVTQGEAYAVAVTADDNVWDYVVAEKNGDTLRLGTRGLIGLRNSHLSAKITMPALSGVSFSGATSGTISGFKSATPLTVQVSGASKLSGDAAAGNVDVHASGASTVSLSGSGNDLRVDVSGASTADMPSFAVKTANVSLSGASRANVNVQSKLDYDLSGASHLSFTGSPAMGRMQTSGASSVDHR